MKPTLLTPGSLAYPSKTEISSFMNMKYEEVIPIQYIVTWIKRKMGEYGGLPPNRLSDRILVIQSETGSGKSTTMPTMLVRVLSTIGTKIKTVLCTQPKVLTTINITRDMIEASFNKDLADRKVIGFSTGFLKERPKRGGLLYATIGTLLAQLKNQPDQSIIEKYKIIIIDEAHERSLETDITLALLKKFYLRNISTENRELPFLILTSATFDTKKYANYFGVPDNIIKVTGRTFKVEITWPLKGTNDYLKESAYNALKIHTTRLDKSEIFGKSDILIFSPGSGEAKNIILHLDKANTEFRKPDSKIPPFIVLFVDSKAVTSESRDYKLLTASPNSLHVISTDEKTQIVPFRRIIISTTVAETGLTLNSLKYVIDSGWNRGIETYYPYGFKGLITRPAAKSRIKQRMGRAGRLFPGEFHPNYTEKSYESLRDIQLADIILEGPGRIFMDIIQTDDEKGFDIRRLDLLDIPPSHSISYSAEQAILFGFVKNDGSNPFWRITNLGKVVKKFSRISMEEARIILLGFVWKVAIFDLINIVSILGRRRKDMFKEKKGVVSTGYEKLFSMGLVSYMNDIPIEVIKMLISCELIELMIVLNGFIKLISTMGTAELIDWCEQNAVKFGGMMEILVRRDDIINDLSAAGINMFHRYKRSISHVRQDKWYKLIRQIKQCLYDGLQDNLLTLNGEDDKYYCKGKKVEVYFDRPYDSPKPKLLVAGSIKLEAARSKDPRQAAPLVYKTVANGICVLDGYIVIDRELTKPRTPV